ncbi:MAG: PilZ domain-containing protein [Treponema sp.]|jgi:hypothetical protein|nr:PilZ domain-containing protein [Treponema sp.]
MALRKETRYPAKGEVYIAEVRNTDAVVKNLSASGLCIESSKFMEIIPRSRYVAEITPDEDSGIGKFSVELESRWIRTSRQTSESGFVIVLPPGAPGYELLKQYIDYLASAPPPES